jgi:hypothetical protein
MVKLRLSRCTAIGTSLSPICTVQHKERTKFTASSVDAALLSRDNAALLYLAHDTVVI